jgi:F-type H+-transporting ATPase subunit b
MNRLIAWILFTSIFAQDHTGSHDTGHESSWIDSWLMPDPGLFLWTLVMFFIVLIILKAKAWGPLMDALDNREKRINDALSLAEKAKQEAEKVSNEYEEMIKKAQGEAQQIVAKGKEAGNKLRDDIERKSKAKAVELLEKSNEEIESAKAKAIDEIKSTSVNLAIQAASKVINKNLDDSTNRDIAKATINEAN